VPGIAHGRASVSGSRRYGQNSSPSVLVVRSSRTARRCRAASSTSGSATARPVGEVAVGQEDDRRAVLEREPHRLERGVEAVARRLRGHDRQRRLAVAAVHREQQVGLLGLGGQAGRRTAALDVDDDQRQLELIASPRASDFRSTPGPLVVVTPSCPANAAPIATPIAAISSSACNVLTPKFLCFESSWRMSDLPA
jgi:hypothetical protein